MKYIVLLVIIVSFTACQEKENQLASEKPTNQIIIGHVHTIYSEIVGEESEMLKENL